MGSKAEAKESPHGVVQVCAYGGGVGAGAGAWTLLRVP